MGGAILQTRRFRSGPIDIEILRSAILLSAHQTRHHVGAADPLPVGVPVNVGVVNAEGAAVNFARRDHVHNHPAALGFALHHPHYARIIDCILPNAPFSSGFNTGTAYLWPLQIEFPVTIDRIGCVSDRDEGPEIRMGIYRDMGDLPDGGALVVESPSTPLGGWRKTECVVAATVLIPAFYWIVWITDTTPTDVYRIDGPVAAGGTHRSRTFAHVYGVFPAVCPATAITDTNTPYVYVRVSSVP